MLRGWLCCNSIIPQQETVFQEGRRPQLYVKGQVFPRKATMGTLRVPPCGPHFMLWAGIALPGGTGLLILGHFLALILCYVRPSLRGIKTNRRRARFAGHCLGWKRLDALRGIKTGTWLSIV